MPSENQVEESEENNTAAKDENSCIMIACHFRQAVKIQCNEILHFLADKSRIKMLTSSPTGKIFFYKSLVQNSVERIFSLLSIKNYWTIFNLENWFFRKAIAIPIHDFTLKSYFCNTLSPCFKWSGILSMKIFILSHVHF